MTLQTVAQYLNIPEDAPMSVFISEIDALDEERRMYKALKGTLSS